MKGDFTRDTFDARKHFSRVLMQQGRVQLDADFNEQASILLHYIQTLAADLIGPYGGPQHGSGFKIGNLTNGDFEIGTGRYYLDGILCENDDDALTYRKQDGFANESRLDPAKTYFVYLDVWERHILPVQDDSIRESALGGPDTCTRAKVVWQVKAHEAVAGRAADCNGATAWADGLPALSTGRLVAQVKPEGPITDACSLPPESRYRGLENQLYRVEVHRGNVDAASIKPTFKWSRDNGTAVYPIASAQGATVYLHDLGRDAHSLLRSDDWVEIVDDTTDLLGKAGALAQVDMIDPVEMTVTLKQPYTTSPTWPSYIENDPRHPLLRRWDQRAMEGVTLDQGAVQFDPANGAWIELESGVQVQFAPPADQSPGIYRTGDDWLIPARVAPGEIEWPAQRNAIGPSTALPQAARGIRHHYAPLAVLAAGAVTSCRTCFSLTEQACADER